MSLNIEILSRAANEARGLCMDAVQASQSGHLGQGGAHTVGIGAASTRAAARFKTGEHTIFNHRVLCLSRDSNRQDGGASDGCALGGQWGIDNLVLIDDSNGDKLDAPAKGA